jgi:hypothetical protein
MNASERGNVDPPDATDCAFAQLGNCRVQPLALSLALGLALLAGRRALATQPVPVLETVFPAGAQIGKTVDLTISGKNITGLRAFQCSAPGVRGEILEGNRVRLMIPAETPPGLYDVWGVANSGISGPRAIFLGNRQELIETEPNESLPTASVVPLNVVINGRMDKGGDADHYRFEAGRGDRVVIECWAERIDSRLRPTLEVFDAAGHCLAVNRGYFGSDPLIDLRIPADGAYIVRVQDLILSGSPEHFYRLDIDTGPRVAFSLPSVVERGKTTRVTLFGWNLSRRDLPTTPAAELAAAERGSSLTATVSRASDASDSPYETYGFDHVDVEISAPQTTRGSLERLPRSAAQAVVEGFAYQLPGGHAPVAIGVTDVPVIRESADNHAPEFAQAIPCPCEVSGRLADPDERDWFAVQALRGEVLHLEVLADRIGSPVDAQLSVLNAVTREELVQFGDEVCNAGSGALSTNHLDPSGRWVVPGDGRYLIEIRNLADSAHANARRKYRLSVRREDPAYQLVAIPRADGASVLNVPRGGREAIDVVVLRQRGFDGPIRISAGELPAGVECPDVWVGLNVEQATVVVSAERNAEPSIGELRLEGHSDQAGRRPVQWATPVRTGSSIGSQRLVSRMPLAVAGDAPLGIVADGHEPMNHHLYGKLPVRHCPGGIVDVAVRVERADAGHQSAVKLIGIGLPATIRNVVAIIPTGAQQGALSFYLPPTLPVGKYSLAVAAETTVPTPHGKAENISVFSNAVILDVQPEAFIVETDPFACTQVRRGETIQVKYRVQRKNGFIGKLHTELAAPGRITVVTGLRGRGETFVGQTDRGMLQITVNDDAPLGRQPFLRLFTVGVVEDNPTFQGADLFPLEIVE